MKTHHKVGVTLNIKGLVGINSNKNFLIHWRIGFPGFGGDEFPTPTNFLDYFLVLLRHLLIDMLPERTFLWLRQLSSGSKLAILFEDLRCLSFTKHRGSWEGNDTCWRMAADLYKLFVLNLPAWRKKECCFFSVVDGIVAGEGNGPFAPTAKQADTLIAGTDLLAVDCVASRLMGFNISIIRYLENLRKYSNLDLNSISILSDRYPKSDFFDNQCAYLDFMPPTAWPHLKITGSNFHENNSPRCW